MCVFFLFLKQHIYFLSFIFAFFPCFKLKKIPLQKSGEIIQRIVQREQKLPGQRRITRKETAVFFRVPGCFHIVQHKRALCPTFGLIWSTYPLIPTERERERKGGKKKQSEDVSAVKGELLAIREPPFNYDTQEIIPRMGPALIRSPSPLDDSSGNLRKLITKVEGGGQ